MEQELVRFDRVSTNHRGKVQLDNFNFRLCAGEIHGFFSVNSQGKDHFLQLLEKNSPIDTGYIYLNDQLINNFQYSDNSLNWITVLDGQRRMIDDLTVYENIYFIHLQSYNATIKNTEFAKTLQENLRYLGSDVDISKKYGELDLWDRIVVALTKPLFWNCKIVLINGLDWLAPSLEAKFWEVVKKLSLLGVGFLYVCNQRESILEHCTHLSVMADGHIVKILKSSQFHTDFLSAYPHTSPKSPTLALDKKPKVFTVDHLTSGSIADVSFSVERGEILAILDQDNRFHKQFIALCSGRIKPEKGTLSVDGKKLNKRNIPYIIEQNPVQTMLIPSMSCDDNLMLSLCLKRKCKILLPRVRQSVLGEYHRTTGHPPSHAPISTVPTATLYDLIYYQAQLCRSKVAILVNPFSKLELETKNQVLSHIQRLKDANIAVIMLVSDNYSLNTLSDRTLVIKHGKPM